MLRAGRKRGYKGASPCLSSPSPPGLSSSGPAGGPGTR